MSLPAPEPNMTTEADRERVGDIQAQLNHIGAILEENGTWLLARDTKREALIEALVKVAKATRDYHEGTPDHKPALVRIKAVTEALSDPLVQKALKEAKNDH